MARQRLSPAMLQRQRWLRALAIARILCAEEGYHTRYLDEITTFIQEQHHDDQDTTETLNARATGRSPGAPPAHQKACHDDQWHERRGTQCARLALAGLHL